MFKMDGHACLVEFDEVCTPYVCCFQFAEGQNSSPSCGTGGKQGVLEGPGPRVQSRPRGSGYGKLME